MNSVAVDSRIFDFPDGWLVMKYDETPYYQHKFNKHLTGTKGWKKEMKGVDLIASDTSVQEPVLYLIESKDYRHYRRNKTILPTEEFVYKVLDTLTGILPTILCSDSTTNGEGILADEVKAARRIRLVYQFEQPGKTSKLYPRAFDVADMQTEIRRELKIIDPHALVIDAGTQHKVAWTVR